MADQALEQFAKAEALAPNNADLLIIIAWFLPQFGQPDRAVELTEKALKLNPNYPYWYNQELRLAYFFGRRFDKSVKYAKRCRNAVHRGSQESRSRCMCASGQAFVNAEPYSYQGVR